MKVKGGVIENYCFKSGLPVAIVCQEQPGFLDWY